MTVDFPSFLPPLALVLATLTALALLISRDWRWSIAAIAIQYLAAFVLVSISWPLEMAIAKMIAGWMAGAILGMAMANAPEAWESKELAVQSARLFRLLAAGTVFIILLGIAPTAFAQGTARPEVTTSDLVGVHVPASVGRSGVVNDGAIVGGCNA